MELQATPDFNGCSPSRKRSQSGEHSVQLKRRRTDSEGSIGVDGTPLSKQLSNTELRKHVVCWACGDEKIAGACNCLASNSAPDFQQYADLLNEDFDFTTSVDPCPEPLYTDFNVIPSTTSEKIQHIDPYAGIHAHNRFKQLLRTMECSIIGLRGQRLYWKTSLEKTLIRPIDKMSTSRIWRKTYKALKAADFHKNLRMELNSEV